MNLKIGLIGEQLAVNYIKDRGYYVIDRNYRTKFGEIDIIAKIDRIIVFIEVKARTSNKFGSPCEAVNYKKQRTIQKLSQHYILYKNLNLDYLSYRFDVIEVNIINKKYKINHIENAF